VSNGKEKVSVLLAWGFGLGHVGQSHLYEHDGAWHERFHPVIPSTSAGRATRRGDARITCAACHDQHQQLEKRS